jgi:hypothetical protein
MLVLVLKKKKNFGLSRANQTVVGVSNLLGRVFLGKGTQSFFSLFQIGGH